MNAKFKMVIFVLLIRCCITSFNGRCCEFPLKPIATFENERTNTNKDWNDDDINSDGVSLNIAKCCSILLPFFLSLLFKYRAA